MKIGVSLVLGTMTHHLTVKQARVIYGKLDGVFGRSKKHLLHVVLAAVETGTHLTTEEIFSPGRPAHLAEARQLVAYFMRRFSNYSLPHIGRLMGDLRPDGRSFDHGTIHYSAKQIANRMDADLSFKVFVELMAEEIENAKKQLEDMAHA